MNFSKFKAAIKKSFIESTGNHDENLFAMALALVVSVKKLFVEKSGVKFSDEPLVEKKPIVQFMQRMRLDAMEKFNQTTFFSVIHYHSPENPGKPAGVLIVYIERQFVPEMLRLLRYPYIDYDDDDEVLDGTGAIVNLVAGQFKKELANLGYADLQMSHFTSYVNRAVNGIEFPKGQTNKYEVSFEIDEKKRLVIEMVMSPLPKAGSKGDKAWQKKS
jgi:hypothetical protein